MSLLQKLFLWLGTKLWKCIDVYAPNKKIKAMTFSNDLEYLKRVQDIELKKHKKDKDLLK